MNNPGTDPENPLPDKRRDDLIATGATGDAPSSDVEATPEIRISSIQAGGEFDPIPQLATPANGPSWGENFQTPWGWLDLILLLVVAIGSTLLAGMLVSMAFFARGVTQSQLQNSGMERSLWILVTQVGVFACVLGYLWFSVAISRHLPFWRTAGWRPLE